MKKILTALFTFSLFLSTVQAQTTAPVNGLSDKREIYYAFKNARIYTDASTVIENATLLILKDQIVAIGSGVAIPSDAVVYDLKGKSIYPAFIDMYSTYGQPAPAPKERQRRENGPQFDSKTKGAYSWNQAIRPEYDAYRYFTIDTKKATELRKMGFGTVLSQSDDGIARGSATVVALGEGKPSEMMMLEKAAACYSFNKGSSTQDYPSSLMGSIALLRQTYYDADWYSKAKKKEADISLDSWIANQLLPQIFEVTDYLSELRADRVGDEFKVKFIIKGAGDEFHRIEEIKKAGNTFIVPLNFPKAFDVSNPYDALNINVGEMKNWELAPANAAMLNQAGIQFAFTSFGTKDGSEFTKNLLKAVQYGLPKDQALRALTQTPAELLKISDKTGSLKTGLLANFFICTKDFFEKDNTMVESWVLGKRYIIKESDSLDIRGKYHLELDTLKGWDLLVSGEQIKPDWTLQKDSTKVKVDFDKDGQQITLKFEITKGKGPYRLNGTVTNQGSIVMSGDGQAPDGSWKKWKATWFAVADSAKKDTSKKDLPIYKGKPWYPNIAYGFDSMPKPHPVLIQHATVWTNESDGILKDADVLINNGKIERIGKGIDPKSLKLSGLEIIDGTGKHITAGIIDEHSHIAISSGVNEGTQSITSEVRIADVINPDDINIYRQLAGGVTTSHLLHGSANAVGGQTILVKLRWGKSAEEMKFENADGFIKFALGENVKQSNWGDNNTTRYPQTRMGVEQTYIDGFTRAREYDSGWKNYSTSKDKSKSETPRRDLELDALAEILNSKRFITCHSYQQGEINMLMHVADSFGFKVNTFTHILEGYKVADKMKTHGAGASSFSDWWGYKYEVVDAIPYNGAILYKEGVVVAFNSDDAEMARRLNQEAAKAVKYGGVSEEEALKFVTLNPAKLLHVDNRVGSIKAGKDADIVLWNDNPLSVYAKPLMTFVDGICYFDIVRDAQLRIRNAQEKQRISREMLEDKAAGSSMQKPSLTLEQLFHCNDLENLPH